MNFYKTLLVFLILTSNLHSMIDYTKNIENPSAIADAHYSLILASFQGDIKKAQEFLFKAQQTIGYDINKVDHLWRNGPFWNPLTAATIMGNVDIIKFLLQHGALPEKAITSQNLNWINNAGAPWQAIPQFFNALDFNFKPWNVIAIAHWASINAPSAQERITYQAIENLLKAKPSTIPSKPVTTPLQIPKAYPSKIPQLPKEDYTSLPQEQKNKKLIEALLDSDYNKFETLIQQGADINAKHKDGLTPLMLASLSNKTIIIKILITHNVHMNDQDDNGFTALMYALQKGRTDIIQLLISNGAQVDIKNNEGKTALDLALNESPQIKNILSNAWLNQTIPNLVNTLDILQTQLVSK